MSTRKLPGGKKAAGGRVRLTASTSDKPVGHHGLLLGWLYTYHYGIYSGSIVTGDVSFFIITIASLPREGTNSEVVSGVDS
jgi:hypothetical protein